MKRLSIIPLFTDKYSKRRSLYQFVCAMVQAQFMHNHVCPVRRRRSYLFISARACALTAHPQHIGMTSYPLLPLATGGRAIESTKFDSSLMASSSHCMPIISCFRTSDDDDDDSDDDDGDDESRLVLFRVVEAGAAADAEEDVFMDDDDAVFVVGCGCWWWLPW